MTEESLSTEVWTYIGADYSYREGGKLFHVYEDETGKTRSFGRPMTRQLPGGRFTMSLQGASVFYQGPRAPVYVGLIEDKERRALLELNHHAAVAELRMARQAKSDMSKSALVELLDPLSLEWARRNRAGRTALIAVVIEVITGRR